MAILGASYIYKPDSAVFPAISGYLLPCIKSVDISADKQWFKQPGFHLAYPEADPVYPFQRIKLTDGQDTGIIMLAAPFYDTNYYRCSQFDASAKICH